MSGCNVKPCSCESEYQDDEYGKKLRLHNIGLAGKASTAKCKCTVCGTKKD